MLDAVSLRCRSWGGSDVGRVRDRNEDRFHCDDTAGVYLVVDGMGGAASGDVAASIAHDIVVRRLGRAEGDAEERVREGIALANNAIVEDAALHPERAGMGCVLTVALLDGGTFTVGHVGDTRLYRIEADGITKLTRDHSPVGEREDRGELTEHEAMRHPQRSVVDRALGEAWAHPSDDLIEVLRVSTGPGDRFLLCTDGVTDQVSTAEISETLRASRPGGAVSALLAKANDRGGLDNATAVLVHVGPGDDAAASRAT